MCDVLSILIYFDHSFIRVLESMGDDRFCFRKTLNQVLLGQPAPQTLGLIHAELELNVVF
jgi:hypothetical protein